MALEVIGVQLVSHILSANGKMAATPIFLLDLE